MEASLLLVDTRFGRRTALRDKKTHLEWLQLNLTANHSYESVLEEQKHGGKFEGWRLATVDELRTLFAHFTGTPDGHSTDPAIDRKFQYLLGGPLSEVTNPDTGWHRISTTRWVGDPVGPDNNMIHYHHGYIAEDTGPVVTVDPDSGGSSIPHFATSSQGSFLVRKHHWWSTP